MTDQELAQGLGAAISDEPILSLQQAINGAQRRAAEAGEPEELEQWLLIAGWLRELRARRIAMGREPDDERNAAADMCCCNVCLQGAPAAQFRDGCPMHPGDE